MQILSKSIKKQKKVSFEKCLESGESQVDACRALDLTEFTVRTIVKNAEKIREVSRATKPLAALNITRLRSTIMVDMERMLSSWIEEQVQHRIPLSMFFIQSKALSLHTFLHKKWSTTLCGSNWRACQRKR